MTTTNRPLVSVFQNEEQAQQAMHELEQAGLSKDQMRYSLHRDGSGIHDQLMELGLGEREAHYYNQEFEAGRTVVFVNALDRQQVAVDILRRNGGYDISTHMSQESGAADRSTSTTGEQRMALREEQLRVNKQAVETGTVGLRKEVVSEQQAIDVPVSHEEVYIEQRAGSGQVSDAPVGEGETLRVPVSAEQVQASKQTVESGEVMLGKRSVQETRRVRETVRREEAHIEREGDAPIHDTDTDPFHPSKKHVEDLLDE